MHLSLKVLIKVHEYTSISPSIFTKGNNFYNYLFAFLNDKIFQKMWSNCKGKNLS